jgi:hypothetical protein
MQQLTQHPKWSPSNKLYYNKFNSQITVGPTEYNGVDLEHCDSEDYRKNQKFIFNDELMQYEVFTTVYTSNDKILDTLIDTYPVHSLSTPVNSDHQNIIEDLHTDTALRTTLYYRKFRFRLVIWRNHRMDVTADDCNQAHISIRDVFRDEAKFLGDRYASTTLSYWSRDLPTVFTNNEPGIMMLKLMLGSKFRFKITKAYLLDDLI